MKELLNIGFNNYVPADKIIAIINYSGAPVKRMRKIAQDKFLLIDATNGRKTRSIIVTNSNHIILSSSHPETLFSRINESNGKQ